MRPVVIKLGGRALEAQGALRELAGELKDRPAVLVHGGGNEVTAWSERFGLAPRFSGGRRVTDPATLEVAAAVLAGLVNKRLVAGLRAHGVDAIGLSAVDGIAECDRIPELGEVGRVTAIDPGLIDLLLANGRVPVLASLGRDDAGALLNVNADDFAALVASALSAEALVLLSDAPGLVLGGAVVPAVASEEIAALLDSPEVTGGMGPKLEAARAATASGACASAWIARWSGAGTLSALLAGRGIGTRIAEGVAHD